MKRKQLFAELTELEDQLLEQYFTMDQELARKHTRKRIGVRVLAVAACMAILLCACVPVGMLAHPAGRAVLKGDSEALTEQLNKIDPKSAKHIILAVFLMPYGFACWVALLLAVRWGVVCLLKQLFISFFSSHAIKYVYCTYCLRIS